MNSRSVLNYRWTVFLLALGYFLYLFWSTDKTAFGWQFRYLTIWALTTNFLVSGQMLRLSFGRTTKDWNSFVSMGVVLNVVVVVNYWKLYFENPASLNASGQGLVWYMEYYLHLLGPLLMAIDAFLILGVFRNLPRVCLYALLLGTAYPLWAEFVVAPMNNQPIGSVTNGLPYPFLNNMEVPQRLTFYGIITVTIFVFIGLGWGLSRSIESFRRRRLLVAGAEKA
jgi:hypothetical protein